jgi:methylenetetrahydrofolate dehydrogenase (NAD+)
MSSRLTSEQNFGPEVKEKASIYVPAIGKVTIVVLLRNLLRIVQNRRAGLSKPAELVERSEAEEPLKSLKDA